MSPVGLRALLATLPRKTDARLLVGYETSDDAAVYQMTDDAALVMTADIITPPVDDPFVFGQIAAANALSDVYAMGGTPVVCLDLVGFPAGKLDDEVLHAIIAGAVERITEAGAILAGGHTTNDEEPKFGLSVVGVVRPDRIWKNVGARPGDALILTKPIGSGVLFNGNLKGHVSEAAMDECIRTLIALNRTAAEVLHEFEVHAVTDVTGFGLLGHGWEMAERSGVTLSFSAAALPLYDGASAAAVEGVRTGGDARNRQHLEGRVTSSADPAVEALAYDPQTSGGLLAALEPGAVPEGFTVIGEVEAGPAAVRLT